MFEAAFVEGRNHLLDPELALWSSVMELAFRDYLSGDNYHHHQAEHWIYDTKPEMVFNSFPNLCDALDLDSTAVREALTRVYNQRHGRFLRRS